ncbi:MULTISPECIES: hypothetical protein [Klebsiella]|uniref:hypothetical protein n=1 Tax=Klebsiella TaxID=570 RepID=UPI00066936BA|nr:MULTISPECIES: hypothetical protein [Klebsiella]MBM1096576.1 hypothetical protein [Klebsiella pneumoniae]MBZ7068111.1 hypothetical protein [Klebsiella oxytoca]MBZ7153564.1 hypothetical protein [Klebsiella oxytoca]MBZ7759436.1 hypothetical protein [Klebsiella oxytoca]HBQ2984511.1 hypothetical protein [Klebsiella pneumoniae]
MRGTQSRDAEILYRKTQQYFDRIPLGELSEQESVVLEALMLDGGIVCESFRDEIVLSLQQEYLTSATREEKDAAIQALISVMAEDISDR